MKGTWLAGFALVCLAFDHGQAAKEPAWNGHTTPGSTSPQVFTPYFVPPGSKSYDSSSPLIHYTGKWTESFSNAYVQQSLRSTRDARAAISFSFTGTGIEWFGNTDSMHGVASVYIDGKTVERVDTRSQKPMKQQRVFWKFDLPYGRHTIKIINLGASMMDLDAFVITLGYDTGIYDERDQIDEPAKSVESGLLSARVPTAPGPVAKWALIQKGSTGVHAMQLAVISDTHALIVDKVEHNPLTISGHPAWAALYNLKTHALKPLRMQSNSFCAGGTFLSNGTMINVGGNPVVEDRTAAADFGDVDGLQSIRIFHPCDSGAADGCDFYENHSRIRMASPRWYNTVLRIADGSAMVIGGSKKGGWINNATVNNPTIEYYPPKGLHGSNGLPIPLPFLVDTLNSNLFPIAFALPDGKIFMAANQDVMIYDWQANSERRLPRIPNGVRVTYPMTGTALLLPLSPDNDYAPEVLLCGGSTIDDKKPGYEISSQDLASAQCSRMLLTEAGIGAGWQVEQMPEARTMPDAVLLPTGEALIVNGAGSGISGYGNVRNQVGASNADKPVMRPILYNPQGEAGHRFSSAGLPTSRIPRLYHSVATLTPDGSIMVAGSNPNLDRSEIKYGTEYRVEWLRPPYMSSIRPEILDAGAKKLHFGQQMKLKVKIPGIERSGRNIKASLMDFGYVTHAVHANSRLVGLHISVDEDGLTVTAPPNGNVYPPGPGWLFVVVDGVPSEGVKVMVGDGQGPPVDEAALQNMLANTIVDQYEHAQHDKEDGSE